MFADEHQIERSESVQRVVVPVRFYFHGIAAGYIIQCKLACTLGEYAANLHITYTIACFRLDSSCHIDGYRRLVSQDGVERHRPDSACIGGCHQFVSERVNIEVKDRDRGEVGAQLTPFLSAITGVVHPAVSTSYQQRVGMTWYDKNVIDRYLWKISGDINPCSAVVIRPVHPRNFFIVSESGVRNEYSAGKGGRVFNRCDISFGQVSGNLYPGT